MSRVADGNDGSASNSDVSGPACTAGSRRRRRLAEHAGVDDAVESEQPHPLGRPAPRLQIAVVGDQDDPDRVDDTAGQHVVRRRVVLDRQCPSVPHGGPHRGGGLAFDRGGLVDRRDGHPLAVADHPSGRLDLGDRAAGGFRVDHAGHVGQRTQRHEYPGRFRRRQPQRVVDAGTERDFDCVAGEFEVDQVTGAVAGKPTHPQLVEVVAQLIDADAEVRCGLGIA